MSLTFYYTKRYESYLLRFILKMSNGVKCWAVLHNVSTLQNVRPEYGVLKTNLAARSLIEELIRDSGSNRAKFICIVYNIFNIVVFFTSIKKCKTIEIDDYLNGCSDGHMQKQYFNDAFAWKAILFELVSGSSIISEYISPLWNLGWAYCEKEALMWKSFFIENVIISQYSLFQRYGKTRQETIKRKNGILLLFDLSPFTISPDVIVRNLSGCLSGEMSFCELGPKENEEMNFLVSPIPASSLRNDIHVLIEDCMRMYLIDVLQTQTPSIKSKKCSKTFEQQCMYRVERRVCPWLSQMEIQRSRSILRQVLYTYLHQTEGVEFIYDSHGQIGASTLEKVVEIRSFEIGINLYDV
ncbi:hypothetical protein WN51_03490 [Melipona quadrifasciata]|uniref:Uncharacterized protein n=1 Tax=Melipona quadrifasciata TaxID=166423 RepID=A0A0M8ZW48_9HYME|nr:hypothetical protein WN51_03490 [Melipona quadrifasciata]